MKNISWIVSFIVAALVMTVSILNIYQGEYIWAGVDFGLALANIWIGVAALRRARKS